MNDIRVIGIGSPFGADRLGWAVIDVLRADGTLTGVSLLHCRQPAELPQLLADCRQAVLVDALLAGLPLGTLQRLDTQDLSGAKLGLSSHGFGVSEAVQLAASLGCLPPQLTVLALEAGGPEQPLEDEWITRLAQAVQQEIRPGDT